jgi:hypothetical protein
MERKLIVKCRVCIVKNNLFLQTQFFANTFQSHPGAEFNFHFLLSQLQKQCFAGFIKWGELAAPPAHGWRKFSGMTMRNASICRSLFTGGAASSPHFGWENET